MQQLPGATAAAQAATAPEPDVERRLRTLFRRAAESASLLADPEASGGMRFACFQTDVAEAAVRLRMTVSVEVVS